MRGRLAASAFGVAFALTSATAGAWEPPIRLSPATPFDHMAADIVRGPGGVLYAAWQELDADTPGDSDVLLTCSSNGGLSFRTPIVAAGDFGDAQVPRLSASYLAASDDIRLDLVFFVAQADQGLVRYRLEPADPCTIVSGTEDIDSRALMYVPDIDTDAASNAYVAWKNDPFSSNDAIHVTVVGSNEEIVSNAPDTMIAGDAEVIPGRPAVAARGTTRNSAQVVVVWDKDLVEDRIGVGWSANGGQSWTTGEIAVAGSNLSQPSVENVGPPGEFRAVVAYTRSVILGGTTSIEARQLLLSGSITTVATNVLGTAPNGAVHVKARPGFPLLAVWEVRPVATTRVVASRSTNAGMSWSTPETIHASEFGELAQPRVAVGSAWSVWTEDTNFDGFLETWFSRDATIGPTAVWIDAMRAERVGGGARVSWTLVSAAGVASMRVERVPGEEPVGSPLTPDPLDDEYSVHDEGWRSGDGYLVEVTRADGFVESYGPVFPAESRASTSGGCAITLGRESPRRPVGVLVLAAGALLLALRVRSRGSAQGQRLMTNAPLATTTANSEST